jgi:hypothetical protein
MQPSGPRWPRERWYTGPAAVFPNVPPPPKRSLLAVLPALCSPHHCTRTSRPVRAGHGRGGTADRMAFFLPWQTWLGSDLCRLVRQVKQFASDVGRRKGCPSRRGGPFRGHDTLAPNRKPLPDRRLHRKVSYPSAGEYLTTPGATLLPSHGEADRRGSLSLPDPCRTGRQGPAPARFATVVFFSRRANSFFGPAPASGIL